MVVAVAVLGVCETLRRMEDINERVVEDRALQHEQATKWASERGRGESVRVA